MTYTTFLVIFKLLNKLLLNLCTSSNFSSFKRFLKKLKNARVKKFGYHYKVFIRLITPPLFHYIKEFMMALAINLIILSADDF